MDERVYEGPAFPTYAQPLSGLRVSWGAVLAGAVGALAVATLLWALSLGIIVSATNPNWHSVYQGSIAAWICRIITILIGAFAGGALAAYLAGNDRRIVGEAHAFLAWSVAFLASSLFFFGILGGMTRTLTTSAVTAAGSVTEAAGTVASSGPAIDQRFVSILESLGYAPREARQMVADGRAQFQRYMRGTQTPGVTAGGEEGPLQSLLKMLQRVAWSWFGTWFVAGVLALLGGMWATGRLTRPLTERVRVRGGPAPETRGGIFVPTHSET